MDRALEAQAAHFFQAGQFFDALEAYNKCISNLPAVTNIDLRINLLLNRSACYLKLKQFGNVVNECNKILQLNPTNSKALGRKIKALCSLGRFNDAQKIALLWIKGDPENPVAKREVERLTIICKALEHDNDDDGLAEPMPVQGSMSSAQATLTNKTLSLPVSSLGKSLSAASLSPGVPKPYIVSQHSNNQLPQNVSSRPYTQPPSIVHMSNSMPNVRANCTESSFEENVGSKFTDSSGYESLFQKNRVENFTSNTVNDLSSQSNFGNPPFSLGSSIKAENQSTHGSYNQDRGSGQSAQVSLSKFFPLEAEEEEESTDLVTPTTSFDILDIKSNALDKLPTEIHVNDSKITLSNSSACHSPTSTSGANGHSDSATSFKTILKRGETLNDDPAIVAVKGNLPDEKRSPVPLDWHQSSNLQPRKESCTTCQQCRIAFETDDELKRHLNSESHKRRIEMEEVWQHRPPPRGLTTVEYSMCPRYFGEGTCRFGDACSQAHSEAELQEWKQRFEQRKKEITSETETYIEKLLERYMNAEKPDSVMVQSLDGVSVHVSSELNYVANSKSAKTNWLFTITGKLNLARTVLLDDEQRKHFHIASITIGPKRNQKNQQLSEQCQEWVNSSPSSSKISGEKVYRIKVQFSTDIYGTFRQTLVLDFGMETVLVRKMCVDSTPVSDLDKLKTELVVSDGDRWDLSTKTVIPFEPEVYKLDDDEKELLKTYPAPVASRFAMSPSLLHPKLTMDNYKVRMHHLLYIEEMAQFSSIAKYNVKGLLHCVDRFMLMPSSFSTAKFAAEGELFAQLKLNSDISEDTSHGRLILQNVHTVYLTKCIGENSDLNTVYEAIVEEKGKNFIYLRLSATCVRALGLFNDTEFFAHVQFHLNRLPLCEMHLAVDRLPDIDVVFPDIDNVPVIPWNPQRHWSEHLDPRLNAKQKEAVLAISAETKDRMPPVLIVGPYGTGKTFTLAQTTLEVLRQNPEAKILICTHSNSAADLYIKDYLHPFVEAGHSEARPLRILYRHRWVQTVHQTVLRYTIMSSDGGRGGTVFQLPTRDHLNKHRVVVTTLSTSRYLVNLNLPAGYFTHILIDEAAQALECEAIMPLALVGETTRVVLAGDHMQLSPELHSDFAKDRNLHVSFLERLYDMYPHQFPCKIMLVENYRSHQAIINYTSELFYDKKLIASGMQPRHDVFYPLTFFTARGEDCQHQNSTAFYNNAEVYEIVERVHELQKSWPKSWGPLNENSIGVVSPYSDQVIRIRSELRKKKLFDVSVERVLNVQGKQFRAIFLSTVRSRHTCSGDSSVEDFMDYGFLSNVKLLNTAITRAQSLVAVVGDPVSLCSIGKCRKFWERFIEICYHNNSLYGTTWLHLRAQLDGVELKKTYILNPLAPEFIPNRLRHAPYVPPEPIAYGKYGFTFAASASRPTLVQRQPGPGLSPHRMPSVPVAPFLAPQQTMLHPPVFFPTRPLLPTVYYNTPYGLLPANAPRPPPPPPPSSVAWAQGMPGVSNSHSTADPVSPRMTAPTVPPAQASTEMQIPQSASQQRAVMTVPSSVMYPVAVTHSLPIFKVPYVPPRPPYYRPAVLPRPVYPPSPLTNGDGMVMGGHGDAPITTIATTVTTAAASSTSQNASTSEPPRENNPHNLFRSLSLQRELYSYMLQSEGSGVASNFVNFLQKRIGPEHASPHNLKKIAEQHKGATTALSVDVCEPNADAMQSNFPATHYYSAKPYNKSATSKNEKSSSSSMNTLKSVSKESKEESMDTPIFDTENFPSLESHANNDANTVESVVVKPFEDGNEQTSCEEMELGNIHIGDVPISLAGGDHVPEKSNVPLYMRRAGISSQPQSYANAVRHRPSSRESPIESVLPTDSRRHCEAEEPISDDPLLLLKNLNIKASPGTQALYQYFS